MFFAQRSIWLLPALLITSLGLGETREVPPVTVTVGKGKVWRVVHRKGIPSLEKVADEPQYHVVVKGVRPTREELETLEQTHFVQIDELSDSEFAEFLQKRATIHRTLTRSLYRGRHAFRLLDLLKDAFLGIQGFALIPPPSDQILAEIYLTQLMTSLDSFFLKRPKNVIESEYGFVQFAVGGGGFVGVGGSGDKQRWYGKFLGIGLNLYLFAELGISFKTWRPRLQIGHIFQTLSAVTGFGAKARLVGRLEAGLTAKDNHHENGTLMETYLGIYRDTNRSSGFSESTGLFIPAPFALVIKWRYKKRAYQLAHHFERCWEAFQDLASKTARGEVLF